MPLQIVEATSDSEFDEIIHCQWTSYETPHNGFFRLFSPINGTGRSARENSIRESKERRLQWHKADPTSHWVKVVDNDFDMVVGAAHWHIHKSDPFIKLSQRPLSAHWWPEGEARAYAEQALRMWMAPRRERMRRPHLLLNTCFVHPQHRRRGVGSLLVKWGTKKADELKVECFVESTDDGMPLYKRHGFVIINEFELNPTTPQPGEEWKKTAEKLQPMHGYFMWRPAGGKYEEGKTVIPWKAKDLPQIASAMTVPDAGLSALA